ncbi:hypothetical protein [Acidovorax sp. PRC11]|uniref:hypothetical protein n=1 Tax=Acidovorax sp. PRC11 TaxID=2962592 RepID=UPI002880E0D7|nr:hypothetical protein [Acidovorax sp. PRC11]MDT0138066.1 hypothetical protein [Acidovorax sp. PRC11]
MTENTTTAAPAATQPEAIGLALDVLREMLSDPDQRLDQCPARMDRANQAARALAGVQAPPAAQEAEPAAWMDPATSDVINSARKKAWLEDFGIGCKTKAEAYTVPLYAHPPRPQADAGAVPGKVTPDMRRVFREAYRVGGFWADRLDYALDRMLAAAAVAPAYAPLPEPAWHAKTIGTTEDGYCAEQMRTYADAHRAPAAAPTQEADGWMPIETAPDGERVLLGPRHAPVVGTVHRPAHWHEEQEPTITVVHYNGNVLVAGYRCSEWHRLPAAGARQDGGA